MKKSFTQEQIVATLRLVESGTSVVGIVDVAEGRQHRSTAVLVGDVRQIARIVEDLNYNFSVLRT